MPCIAGRARPLVLRGTLTTFRRRCGKPSCRCATGEPHESPGADLHRGWPHQDPDPEPAPRWPRSKRRWPAIEQAHAELERAAQEGIVALRGRRAGTRTRSTAAMSGRGEPSDAFGGSRQLLRGDGRLAGWPGGGRR